MSDETSTGQRPAMRTTMPPKMATAKPKAELAPLVEAPQGFREREQTPMAAWDTPGVSVLAYFVGFRDSTKYPGRKLVDLVDDDGVVTTYPCPVMLEQLLRGAKDHQLVCIYYRGEEGQTKQFQVFVQ